MSERLYTMMLFHRGQDVEFARGVTADAWRALFGPGRVSVRPEHPVDGDAWLVPQGIGASDREAQRRAVVLAEMGRSLPKEKA